MRPTSTRGCQTPAALLLLLASCTLGSRVEPVAPRADAPVPRGDGGFTFVIPDGAAAAPGPGPGPLPAPGWNCGPGCYAEAGAPERFAGPADPAAASAPRLVYPLPGSLHPINIGDITFHWHRASPAQTLFRIHLSGAGRAYDFYVPCDRPASVPQPAREDACVHVMPPAPWLNLAAENRGTTMQVAVAATDGKGPVATSAPQELSFSPSPVEGGLYYFSTALQGLYRLAFGSRKALPFIVPGTPANRFSCGGCHAVSRDGNVVAFSAEQDGYLTVARADDTGHPTIAPAVPPRPDGNMITLNRDGSLVLVSYGVGGDNGQIAVRATASGAEVARLDPAVLGTPERRVYFPEWSPDGKEIVATLASQDERPWSVNNGYLVVIPYNDGAFGPARVLVPADPALFHFYPTWSPDGQWVAFASAARQVKSYDNASARLRLVSRQGGRVYELGRATQAIGKTSTWPKFAPFQQAGGQLIFLTFNSKMDYGLVLQNSADPTGGAPQLWFAAIDLRRLDSGDPSSAPIWLPFQEVRQRNHLGFWTEKVSCQTGTSPCGEDEVCVQGGCTPIIQ
jgi:hypothetical protein